MKISLITVTYNSAETLTDTIISVLAQTYKNIEYIIVDGASNDNTIDIVKMYESQFGDRIKYILEKDKGLYDAMNKGIDMASGDVIGILNSDDFFTSDSVLQIVAQSFLSDKTLDAVYGDVHFVSPNNLHKCIRYYSSKIFRPYLMRLGFMPAHPSFYLRKKYFDQYGKYRTDYRIAADFEFLLRIIFVGKIKTLYLPIDMVTMRIGGASTSGISSNILIMKEHLKACKENSIYTNRLILSLRYFYKIIEVIKSKIRY